MVMVTLYIFLLLFIAVLSEVVFDSESYRGWLVRVNLDRKPFNCKSCLTFWLTFLYSWLFLFSLSWALVAGFVFFTLSLEGYTETFTDYLKKWKK